MSVALTTRATGSIGTSPPLGTSPKGSSLTASAARSSTSLVGMGSVSYSCSMGPSAGIRPPCKPCEWSSRVLRDQLAYSVEGVERAKKPVENDLMSGRVLPALSRRNRGRYRPPIPIPYSEYTYVIGLPPLFLCVCTSGADFSPSDSRYAHRLSNLL